MAGKEETSFKLDPDKFPGVVSALFEKVFFLIKIGCEKVGLKLNDEFTLFTVILVYIIIDKTTSLSPWIIASISILWLINLLFPNIKFIRKRWFKTKKERIQEITKKEDHIVIAKLEKILNYDSIEKEILKMLFQERFKENYAAHKVLFQNTRLSEENIRFFLKEDFILKTFVDDDLIQKFIDSGIKNISYSTFLKLYNQLKKRDFSKRTVRKFLHKYYNYAPISQRLKKSVEGSKSIIGFLIFLTGITMFVTGFAEIFLIIVFLALGKINNINSSTGAGTLLLVFGVSSAATLLIAITEIIVKKIVLLFFPKKLN